MVIASTEGRATLEVGVGITTDHLFSVELEELTEVTGAMAAGGPVARALFYRLHNNLESLFETWEVKTPEALLSV